MIDIINEERVISVQDKINQIAVEDSYFDLIDKVDLFVFFDDVQLTKRSWQTRNPTNHGLNS